MKPSFAKLSVALFGLVFFGWAFVRATDRATSLPPHQTGSTAISASVPVVVELFTSEGCSTCPPADALLARLESQQPIPKTQIIALEEHVDYWNSDGWVDPFSSREWTLRQQDYTEKLKDNPYTPQLVVDGHSALVGSREDLARQAIATASAQPKVHVALTLAPSGKPGVEQATISVDQLTGTQDSDKSEVWLAVTESGLHSSVTAGENAGSDLHHASVVRTLRKITTIDRNKAASYSGSTPVHLDSSWKPQNVRVVVFVQEKKSRQIVGAAAAAIQQ
jgi:hypothetical protein